MKYFFLIIVMFTAVFFRVWRISEMPPGLYPDEAMNGNNALEALHTGNFKTFYPENNGREGLFINIQAMSVAAFGNKPWALRLMSSMFGVFTVLGVYFLAKELFKNFQFSNTNFQSKSNSLIFKQKKSIENSMKIVNWKLKINLLTFLNNITAAEIIALISSFFLSVSFWHINFSRIGFRAIMAPFFLVWGLFFLFFTLNRINYKKEVRELSQEFKSQISNLKIKSQISKIIIFSIIGGFLYGLGFHSYIAYRITPVLVLLPFLYFWFKKKEIRGQIFVSAILFFAAAFVAISPLFLYFYQNPQDFLGRTSQISVFSSGSPLKQILINTVKTIGMFWYQGDFNFRHNLAGEPELWWPVGILFALGILICIKNIIQISNLKSQNHNSKLKNFQNSKQTNSSFGHWNLFRNSDLEIRNFKAQNILPELLLLAWLIAGLLPVIISNEGIPHALRAIIVLPAVMIISGIALQKIIFKTREWLNRQKEKFPELSSKITRIQKESIILLFFFFITVASVAFNQYFFVFASSPYVQDAFSADYVKLGNYLNTLPKNMEKYVIVNADGTDVRGLPMPTQTVMFITKTFLPEWQKEKNLHYILPENLSEIFCLNSCVITMLNNDPPLRNKLKEQIKNLVSDGSFGFVVLRK